MDLNNDDLFLERVREIDKMYKEGTLTAEAKMGVLIIASLYNAYGENPPKYEDILTGIIESHA